MERRHRSGGRKEKVLPLLVVAFVVVPLAELAVVIRVGQWLGVADTIALLFLISVFGAFMVRREGMGVWRRFQSQLASGSMPGTELVDGVLILVAGALLLTPGFLTDAVGLSLLVPPVRAGLRKAVRHRLTGRIQRFGR